MKIALVFDGKTPEERAKELKAFEVLLAGKAAKGAKTTTKKSKKAEEEEDEDEEEEEDEDESDDEDEDEDDSDDEDEEESEDDEEDEDESDDEDEEGPSLEDVLAACQKYAKKHGRAAVPVILKKFKVESARDLKPAQFEKVLAAFKAKPKS